MSASDVVVVGAGLAGLTAALTAADCGATVTLLDSRVPGGRAGTATVDPGVVFNGGPHAWYSGGRGAQVLREFGIIAQGGVPDTAHGRALRDGVLHPLPSGPIALLRTRLLSSRSKVTIARVLARLDSMDPDVLADRSVRHWMCDLRLTPDASDLLAMLIRTATYVGDVESFSADAALRQVQLSLDPGVQYLDGGFQQVVDALEHAAVAVGVQILRHTRATGIEQAAASEETAVGDRSMGRAVVSPRWTVHTAAGPLHTGGVVIATGGVESVRALAPVPLATDGLGDAVTAACLELAVSGSVAQPIVLGVGVPLYLSVHQPPADLAPEGISVVHATRYGVRSSAEDAAELWALAALGGITRERVVAHRFLHRMVVTGGIPLASAGGLPARPGVRLAGVEGVLIAGDWVGPDGMLADAAISSGHSAGTLAAAAAAAAAVRGPALVAESPVRTGNSATRSGRIGAG